MPVVKFIKSAVYGGEGRAIGEVADLAPAEARMAVIYGDAVEYVAEVSPPEVIEHREPVVQSRDPKVRRSR